MRGIGKHQESEKSLSALSVDELREDFANLRDLGVNLVRLAHYPHARLAYDLADEHGILVWAENGHSNGVPSISGDTGERITREMTRQNYNHPAIVIWSVGNEADYINLRRFSALARAEDATRLVAYASNSGKRTKKKFPDLLGTIILQIADTIQALKSDEAALKRWLTLVANSASSAQTLEELLLALRMQLGPATAYDGMASDAVSLSIGVSAVFYLLQILARNMAYSFTAMDQSYIWEARDGIAYSHGAKAQAYSVTATAKDYFERAKDA